MYFIKYIFNYISYFRENIYIKYLYFKKNTYLCSDKLDTRITRHITHYG